MAHAINLSSYTDFADQAAQRGILARLQQVFANHRAYRATHDELDALSDRDLADIGLSRQTIRDISRAAVYGN